MIFGALIDSSLAFFLLAYFVKQNDIAYGLVSFERERSESLLQNMLPSSIAARLKDGTEQVANRFDEVSVLFADMVGLLNEIFTEFDSITLRHGPRATGHGVEKISTSGDNYVVAAGIPEVRVDGAVALVRVALEIV